MQMALIYFLRQVLLSLLLHCVFFSSPRLGYLHTLKAMTQLGLFGCCKKPPHILPTTRSYSFPKEFTKRHRISEEALPQEFHTHKTLPITCRLPIDQRASNPVNWKVLLTKQVVKRGDCADRFQKRVCSVTNSSQDWELDFGLVCIILYFSPLLLENGDAGCPCGSLNIS